jgi:TatD DNase family protein
MTWLYDSHIHLSDPAYQEDLNHTIKGMESMKIKACCVSMDYSNSKNIQNVQIMI